MEVLSKDDLGKKWTIVDSCSDATPIFELQYAILRFSIKVVLDSFFMVMHGHKFHVS